MRRPSKEVPSEGSRVGLWTVVGFVRKHDKCGRVRRYVKCQCACGSERDVLVYHLLSGATTNCGCVTNVKHGESSSSRQNPTVEYSTWAALINRCENQEDKSYKDYGGRGIKVCQRWRNSFADFLKDMGRRPSEKHSIDRYPDNNGDYCPGNCRWATHRQQCLNKRNNRILTVNGESKTMTEWAEETGIRVGTISERLRLGWSEEQSVLKTARSHTRR